MGEHGEGGGRAGSIRELDSKPFVENGEPLSDGSQYVEAEVAEPLDIGEIRRHSDYTPVAEQPPIDLTSVKKADGTEVHADYGDEVAIRREVVDKELDQIKEQHAQQRELIDKEIAAIRQQAEAEAAKNNARLKASTGPTLADQLNLATAQTSEQRRRGVLGDEPTESAELKESRAKTQLALKELDAAREQIDRKFIKTQTDAASKKINDLSLPQSPVKEPTAENAGVAAMGAEAAQSTATPETGKIYESKWAKETAEQDDAEVAPVESDATEDRLDAEPADDFDLEAKLSAARAARDEKREGAQNSNIIQVAARAAEPGSTEAKIAGAMQDSRRPGWSSRPVVPIPAEYLGIIAPGDSGQQEVLGLAQPVASEQNPGQEVAVASQDFDEGWVRKAKNRGAELVEGAKHKYETYASWRDEPYLKQDKDRLERDNPWVDQVEVLRLKSVEDVNRLIDGYNEAEKNGNLETWLTQTAWQRSIYDELSGDPVEMDRQLTENRQKYKEEILTLVQNADLVPDDSDEFDAVVDEHGEVVAKYYTAKEKLDNLTGLQAKIAKGAGAVRNAAQKITSYPYAAGVWLHGKLNKAEPTVEDRRLMRAGSYLVSLGTLGLALSRAKAGLGGIEDVNLDFLSFPSDQGELMEVPSQHVASNGGGEYARVASESVPPLVPSTETGTPPNVDTSLDNELQTGVQPPVEVEAPAPPTTETLTVKKGDDWYEISEDLLHEHLKGDDGKRIPLDMGKRQDVIDALRDANPGGLKAGNKIDISTALSTIEDLKEEVKFAFDDIASNTSLYKVQAGDTIPEIADRLIEANGGDKRLKNDVVKALIDSNVTYNGSKHWIDEGQIINLEDAQQVVNDKLEALTVTAETEPAVIEQDVASETTPEASVEQPDVDQFDLSTEVNEKLAGNEYSGGSEALTSSQELELSTQRFNDVMRTTGVPKASWTDVMAIAGPQLLQAGLASKGIFGNTVIKTNLFGFVPDAAKRIIRKASLRVTTRR